MLVPYEPISNAPDPHTTTATTWGDFLSKVVAAAPAIIEASRTPRPGWDLAPNLPPPGNPQTATTAASDQSFLMILVGLAVVLWLIGKA